MFLLSLSKIGKGRGEMKRKKFSVLSFMKSERGRERGREGERMMGERSENLTGREDFLSS